MKEEFDLDSLKEVWQNQKLRKEYSSQQIFGMLKKRSITSVKWIFIISLIEVSSLFLLTLAMFIFKRMSIADYHQKLTQFMGNMNYVYELMNVLIFLVAIFFVIIFYRFYKAIRVQDSVKDLSQNIINFRKSVDYFIYFNLFMLVVSMVLVISQTLINSPEYQKIEWQSASGIGLIFGILFIVILGLGFMWVYYYLVYGTFTRRLKRNLNELQNLN